MSAAAVRLVASVPNARDSGDDRAMPDRLVTTEPMLLVSSTSTRRDAEAMPSAPAQRSSRAAVISFIGQSSNLSAADVAQLQRVAAAVEGGNGYVRVIGHAAQPARSGPARLANFSASLDRANAVATALMRLGVAPTRILINTAENRTDSGSRADQRAEVFIVD